MNCNPKRQRGNGKTSISAAFATLNNNTIVADCDVDAANLHLI
jgi:MinD superfamily P-loop ATPase